MNIVLLEEIVLFENVFEFNVYKYCDEINLNDSKNFVCNLKVIINKVKEIYKSKTNQNQEVLVLVNNINTNYNENLKQEIINCICDELVEFNVKKEEINLITTKS